MSEIVNFSMTCPQLDILLFQILWNYCNNFQTLFHFTAVTCRNNVSQLCTGVCYILITVRKAHLHYIHDRMVQVTFESQDDVVDSEEEWDGWN